MDHLAPPYCPDDQPQADKVYLYRRRQLREVGYVWDPRAKGYVTSRLSNLSVPL